MNDKTIDALLEMAAKYEGEDAAWMITAANIIQAHKPVYNYTFVSNPAWAEMTKYFKNEFGKILAKQDTPEAAYARAMKVVS